MIDVPLLPKQQKIYLKLLKLDIKAAEAYRGALKVLRDRENPRARHSASNAVASESCLILRALKNHLQPFVMIVYDRSQKFNEEV
jgi:hypothetical protein